MVVAKHDHKSFLLLSPEHDLMRVFIVCLQVLLSFSGQRLGMGETSWGLVARDAHSFAHFGRKDEVESERAIQFREST